jgi:hypothetical protein
MTRCSCCTPSGRWEIILQKEFTPDANPLGPRTHPRPRAEREEPIVTDTYAHMGAVGLLQFHHRAVITASGFGSLIDGCHGPILAGPE